MSSLPYVLQPRAAWFTRILQRLSSYWELIKDLQTGLLVVTAAAGYASGCCTNLRAGSLAGLAGSLALAVSGCTILNMVYDRDIDARMRRTANRPLPSGRVRPWEAALLGTALAAAGTGWAFGLDRLYGGVVLAGLLLDALIYTVWLKRRTPFAIILGGLAGGMPALAGRVLASGQIDAVGLLLALGILLWIPTHILTYHLKHAADYARAGIPTIPAAYGAATARTLIAAANLLSVGAFWLVTLLLHLPAHYQWISAGLGTGLVVLSLVGLARPGVRLNFILYKGASIYMLASMLILILGGF